MSSLKAENLKKCVSLLREFMEEAPMTDKKKVAILALNQLQTITAGTNPADEGSEPAVTTSVCSSRPRVYGSP